MKTDYEQFCDTLNTIEMPLQDKMKLQQAAYKLASARYHEGFDASRDMALNHK